LAGKRANKAWRAVDNFYEKHPDVMFDWDEETETEFIVDFETGERDEKLSNIYGPLIKEADEASDALNDLQMMAANIKEAQEAAKKEASAIAELEKKAQQELEKQEKAAAEKAAREAAAAAEKAARLEREA